MLYLIFLFASMLLPIILICKIFENSYDERVNSKEFCNRKKHDYYINKFLNYTPLDIKND